MGPEPTAEQRLDAFEWAEKAAGDAVLRQEAHVRMLEAKRDPQWDRIIAGAKGHVVRRCAIHETFVRLHAEAQAAVGEGQETDG